MRLAQLGKPGRAGGEEKWGWSGASVLGQGWLWLMSIPQGWGWCQSETCLEFPDFLQEIWMEISLSHGVSFPDSLYLTCSSGIWV